MKVVSMKFADFTIEFQFPGSSDRSGVLIVLAFLPVICLLHSSL